MPKTKQKDANEFAHALIMYAYTIDQRENGNDAVEMGRLKKNRKKHTRIENKMKTIRRRKKVC